MKKEPALLTKTKNLCADLGIRPDTSHRGQHFLINSKIRDLLLEEIPILPVIEIGAGLGTLTEPLAKRGLPLRAIETDQRFIPFLGFLEGKYPQLISWFTSALKIDFAQLAKGMGAYHQGVWLAGSPPYQLMEPLLMKFVSRPAESQVILGVTFLISQRSAREIIRQQPPRTKLGLLANSLFSGQIVMDNIGPENFWPRPRTQSAIVKLIRHLQPAQPRSSFIWRYLFRHPRAKVKNALREALIALSTLRQKETLTKNQARQIIQQLSLPEKISESAIGQLSNKELGQLDQKLAGLIFKNYHY